MAAPQCRPSSPGEKQPPHRIVAAVAEWPLRADGGVATRLLLDHAYPEAGGDTSRADKSLLKQPMAEAPLSDDEPITRARGDGAWAAKPGGTNTTCL